MSLVKRGQLHILALCVGNNQSTLSKVTQCSFHVPSQHFSVVPTSSANTGSSFLWLSIKLSISFLSLQYIGQFVISKIMIAHTGGRGRLISELDLCSEFQASQGYIMRPCLKKQMPSQCYYWISSDKTNPLKQYPLFLSPYSVGRVRSRQSWALKKEKKLKKKKRQSKWR